MGGLTAYGAYIPYHRLSRATIGAALGTRGGKGARAVASYDEDTTSMGVEAARIALRASPAGKPQRLYFATAAPAYMDKTNAAAIHAALGLDESAFAADMGGAVRSGAAALLAAAESSLPAMAVLSDIRFGLPGGADESGGGDGAAAFVFGGDAPPIATVLSHGAATAEFLDRWREPTSTVSRTWEERFGEHVYGPLADAAFADACKQAGVTPQQIDHLIVAGVHPRAARSFAKSAGVAAEALASDLSDAIGNAGTAQAGIVLADVLDRAGAGQTIAVVVLADGASVLMLRTTDALPARRAAVTVQQQIAAGDQSLAYTTYLSWRGMLDREPPRRPDPEAPAAPPSQRMEDWKFAFAGSRCDACGTRHMPPVRVCVSCGETDRMSPEPLADTAATIVTFTIDRLAYTPSPPLVMAIVDFDGGGRFRCQLTDVDPATVAIGDRLQMTFRKFVTAGGGIHNYFWKARPARDAAADA